MIDIYIHIYSPHISYTFGWLPLKSASLTKRKFHQDDFPVEKTSRSSVRITINNNPDRSAPSGCLRADICWTRWVWKNKLRNEGPPTHMFYRISSAKCKFNGWTNNNNQKIHWIVCSFLTRGPNLLRGSTVNFIPDRFWQGTGRMTVHHSFQLDFVFTTPCEN